MKAVEQYFPQSHVLFIMLCMVVVWIKGIKIPKCDQSVERYRVVRKFGSVYYPVQGCFNL